MMKNVQEECKTSGVAVPALVSQCDDLMLTEILTRLPQKSVFRFKCVCKAWNRLISAPYFQEKYIQSYQQHLKTNIISPQSLLLGFFHGRPEEHNRNPYDEDKGPNLSFLPTTKEGEVIKSHADFIVKKVRFYVGNSSHGLILCGWHPLNYYIYHPITNRYVPLPKPSRCGRGISIGFSCEEEEEEYSHNHNNVIHFTVVIIGAGFEDKLKLQTFASRAGTWKESWLHPAPNLQTIAFPICDVVGGVFYWEACENYKRGSLAAYDPKNGNSRMQLIVLPVDIWPGEKKGLSESSNGFLQCALSNQQGFSIWVLKRKLSQYYSSDVIKSSEWLLRVEVKYKDLTANHLPGQDISSSFISFHPLDTMLMYFRVGETIFSYNLETKRAELVKDTGGGHYTTHHLYPYIQPAWPYSLPDVSQAPNRSSRSAYYSSSLIHRRRFATTRRGRKEIA